MKFPFLKAYQKSCLHLRSFSWTELSEESEISYANLEAVRVAAFELQSLGRIFELSSKKDKVLIDLASRLRANAKYIEDSLGAFLFAWEMDKALGQSNSQLALKQESALRLRQAKDLCAEQTPSLVKAAEELGTLLEKLFAGPWDLRYRYLKGLRRTLKKVKTKVSKSIDPNLLEDGTHELRRTLRWAVMGFIYPQGLFSYEESETPYIASKYTQLVPQPENSPVAIKPWSLDLLSDWVGKLGSVKDQGLVESYKRALESESVELEWNKSFPQAIDATRSCMEDIVKLRPLQNLRKSLKSAMDL